LLSNEQLAAERRQELNILNNEGKEKWIEDDVERETVVASKRFGDTEIAMKEKHEDRSSAGSGGLTTREPRQTFREMLDAVGYGLSNLASSDDGDDGEGNGDREAGKLWEDDEPGWVMGTISKTVQHRMERLQQKQMKLDELTQPGWEDAANYFRDRDKKYRTTELKALPVIRWYMDDDAATRAPTTFGELMESYDIIPGLSQMPQGTS
jgi:hypothetical protein